jgi:hypothetical protein
MSRISLRRIQTYRKPARQRRSFAPRLEILEDRTVLSTVHALFDLTALARAPFPSNVFTVDDDTQNTGLRVNLPLPDSSHPQDRQDTQVLNTLDGFNLQPRLSIPFDGPIDVTTVSSNTVFLISLGDTLNHHDGGGQVVGINQVVWDPYDPVTAERNTLHVWSNDLLDQHTRYALIVTNGIHDINGHSVEASESFQRFRQEVRGDYKHDLLDAIHAAHHLGVREGDIVTASVFTTESATAILEKIRDQIHASTPDPADFNLGLGGERAVFNRADVTGIHWEQQTGDNPPNFTPTNLNLPLLDIIPGAVGQIAFGKYLSPDYEVHPGEYIPPVGTRTGTPGVQSYNEIYFNLFLPSGPKPAGGWPVAIYGHNIISNKNTAPLSVAAMMAAYGIATVAINVPGFGFGPLGTLTVNQTGADAVTFPAGGRGIDQNGDHIIGAGEGQYATAPQAIILNRDAQQRQTVADLMQLVRVIQVGVDVNGDGCRDLDPSRIYYFGQSIGGMYGTIFLAVEPSVRTGAPNVPDGSYIELSRLGPGNRSAVGQVLASRVPPLLNPPGVTAIDGVAVGMPFFNENMPLRDDVPMTVRLADGSSHVIQSPVINTVAGAMALQEVTQNYEWVLQSGNTVAYAPHLRKAPLAGVPAKSVIFQFAEGDQTAPNPTNTAILRAGDLADRTTFYRNDLAFAENPAVPKNPHFFLTSISSTVPRVVDIALAAQRQIATFFASDGRIIDDLSDITTSDGTPLFEVPIQGPLPESLNFIPDNPSVGPTSVPAGAVGSPPSRLLSGIFAGVISSLAPPVLPVAGSALVAVLPRLEQYGTADAPVPVAQRKEPPPAAPAWLRRGAPPAPLPLLDRVFAGLDSSVPFDGFADDLTLRM